MASNQLRAFGAVSRNLSDNIPGPIVFPSRDRLCLWGLADINFGRLVVLRR
jgi:hypothetical protein